MLEFFSAKHIKWILTLRIIIDNSIKVILWNQYNIMILVYDTFYFYKKIKL